MKTYCLILIATAALVGCGSKFEKLRGEFEQAYQPGSYTMGNSTTAKEDEFTERINLTKDTLRHLYFNGSGLNNEAKLGSYGIDISHHNGSINWDKVMTDTLPEPISYVIIKATEGIAWKDPVFESNWKKARQHGLTTGAYHFYIQTKDPLKQANNFLSMIRLGSGDLFPILDIEANCIKGDCPELRIDRKQLIKNLKLFIDTVQKKTKSKVIIYTNDDFSRLLLKEFKENPFWIARYGKSGPDCFLLLDPPGHTAPCLKKNVRIGWQYTKKGKINGIGPEVDFNIFCDYCFRQYLLP